MYRYGQFCPIAIACEIVAQRWTPLILRDLLCGKRHFNELRRGLPLISRTLLASRLRELEAAGMIERVPKPNGRGSEYRLSPAGAALQPVILQLGEWSRRWVYRHVSKDDLDPMLLMWDLHRRLRTDALPEGRVVVQFEFRGLPRAAKDKKCWWLVIERPEVELCLKDPGYEVDLVVNADLFAMTRVWMGEQSPQDAARQGLITLQGRPALVKAFPGWLRLSAFLPAANASDPHQIHGVRPQASNPWGQTPRKGPSNQSARMSF